MEEKLLEKVVRSELEIPHAMLEMQKNAEAGIRENVMGKWESLKNWFLDSEKRECECKKVLRITNDVIRSILQNAALLVQIQNMGVSRKNEYKKFLELFLSCEDLDEARRVSAHVFGVQKIQHFKTIVPREEDSINSSVYGEEPASFLLKPHTRSYREKKEKRGFEDKSMEKLMQRQVYLSKARRQKEIVLHYIKEDRIIFSEIQEIISAETRTVFLQWIAQANMSSQKLGRTEYGQEYRMIRKKGNCVLKCEDGDLVMPSFVLEFKEV